MEKEFGDTWSVQRELLPGKYGSSLLINAISYGARGGHCQISFCMNGLRGVLHVLSAVYNLPWAVSCGVHLQDSHGNVSQLALR